MIQKLWIPKRLPCLNEMLNVRAYSRVVKTKAAIDAARKFVFDALVTKKIIVNDGWKEILFIGPPDFRVEKGVQGVLVIIKSDEDQEVTS